jgi:magnesium chelatase family protein
MVTISRAARQATFPARFQLVATMNPCPCGWLGAPAALGRACRCTPDAAARYRGKLSGPLLDRIDLQVEVLAASADELLALPAGEASQAVAARVARARQRQLRRQGCPNGRLEAGQLDKACPLDAAASRFLRHAAQQLGWSGRRLHRCLKVALTISDLATDGDGLLADDAVPVIAIAHLAEALQLGRALG